MTTVMPPIRYQQDGSSSTVGLVRNNSVKPKVIYNSISEQQVKRKKKKKKGKHYVESDEGVPSPNQSLDDSYNQAKSQAIDSISGLFSRDEIDHAILHLEANKKKISSDDLIDTVYELQQLALSNYNAKTQDQLNSVGETNKSYDNKLRVDAFDENSSDCDGDTSEDDYSERLTDALREVKDKYQEMIDNITIKCQICHDVQANILLLPCGHLVCCDSCLMDVRRCPISRCNKVVRGTKEVFFA